MAGSATFTWTEADYTAALRTQTWLAITRRTWIVMGVLAVLGATIAASPLLDGYPPDWNSGLIGAIVALFVPLCLLSLRWHAPRTARRIFRQQPSLSEPVTVTWSAEAFSVESASGSSRRQWRDLHFWSLRNGVFFLADNERTHRIIPAQSLGDLAADLEATVSASGARRR